MAALAKSKNIRFAVIFNPVTCEESEEIETLTIERELARFRRDHPEVVFPFPLITTWPHDQFVDPFHLFSYGAKRMSERIGPELRKMFDDPDYRGVPAKSVEALTKRIDEVRTHVSRPPDCEPTTTGAASDQNGATFTNCLGMQFATIPAGEFVIGSCPKAGDCPAGAQPDAFTRPSETPAVRIRIDKPYQIGRHEVTIREFGLFLRYGYDGIGRDPRPAGLADDPGFLAANRGGDDQRPVVKVSWNDAQAFVGWLNRMKPESDRGTYRLPSEAEWERAARGGQPSAYWWGDAPETGKANCVGCAPGVDVGRSRVGTFPPNPYGLFDMNGNVWEWAADCYATSHRSRPTDGRAYLWEKCDSIVVRGGAFDHPALFARAATRIGDSKLDRSPVIGFRVLRELP
jgi:formylglycine-generating enzyme required for sulfatase activity